jgi:hypothetical protein
MATPQLSPGIITREVDLTVGRAENVLDNIGAIAGPFSIGPVEEPVNITTERDLLQIFGNPSSTNNQYEYWMSASSYLSYGGILKVVRVDDASLNNSNAAVGAASTALKIKNFDDYNSEYSDDDLQSFYFAAKNPGSWANNLKVCFIDDEADQIINLSAADLDDLNITVGLAVTTPLNVQVAGNGTVESFTGFLKGIITGLVNDPENSNSSIDVKIVSRVSSSGVETPINYAESESASSFESGDTLYFVDGSGDLIGLANAQGFIEAFSFTGGSEILSEADEVYTGISTGIVGGSGSGASFTVERDSNGDIDSVEIVDGGVGYQVGNQLLIPGSLIGGGGNIQTISGTGTVVGTAATYTGLTGTTSGSGVGAEFTIERNGAGSIVLFEVETPGIRYQVGDTITILGSLVGGVDVTDNIILTVTGVGDEDSILVSVTQVAEATDLSVASINDWYNQQTLNLQNSTIFWRSIAEKPKTTEYTLQRNGKNDALHVVIVDDTGSVSGIQGNILEKHLNLSKSRDAISSVDSPIKIWYKDYLATFSRYIYAGANPSSSNDVVQGTSPSVTGFSVGFTPLTISDGIWGQNAQGSVYNVIGNKTYNLLGGADYGSGTATLSSLVAGYDLFSNKDEIEVDFLIYGPSLLSELESQAKANKLISIANSRKDCIAVISPHRTGVVNETNPNTQTNNIVKFFSPLSSSSYAVFDSGYKYTYDRFNNKFVYIPCNADVAGLMARTNVTAFPWFSPAGQQRGVLNNAIKLSYNPNKSQRDLLYSNRVNSIINQPGSGIILFGDKTALGFASAFDRINVRRLFLTVEQALERSANAQLFEFNDQVTRSNFVNIVEPFLRDVQSKRGVFDFRVICDESNNTPDIIDNNEFRADIFLKPTRSINYITLTFVATRTGVSFEEVVGNV